MFLLATVGLGAAAVNTGNNLMYLVLGLLLSLIILSGLLSESALRRLQVSRRMPKRLFAGSVSLVELTVHNRKRWIPSYSIELEDVVEGEAAAGSVYFLKVSAGASQTASYRRTPSRRGRLVLGEVVARTRYPFGLFEKARRLRVSDELLVYPALVPPPAHAALDNGVGPDVPLPRPGPGVEIAGLRAYRPGDEARSIHWRRSAALGKTVVRERHSDAARRLTLRVDEAEPEGADDAWRQRFERRLSEAAASARQALERGASVEAVARSGRSPRVLPGQPPDPIWRFLATLESVPVADAPPLPDPEGER
ncbi:MAG: DUF58 domain-containing protein [Sandaracinaceae bacterium]